MRLVWTLAILFAVAMAVDQPAAEAPAGFDDKSNGMVDEATHDADRESFDEVETVEEGLGPIYNAQSCRECHQDPVSGGASQVTELRVGHLGPDGKFRNPEIPIARGAEIITGRTLVNDRAICPNGTYPDTEIHERFPDVVKTGWWGDGETREEMRDRVVVALQQIAEEHPGGRVLVVTHGGPVRALLIESGLGDCGPIGNCARFEVRLQDGRFVGID